MIQCARCIALAYARRVTSPVPATPELHVTLADGKRLRILLGPRYPSCPWRTRAELARFVGWALGPCALPVGGDR